MDACSDPEIKEVIVQAGAQLGKSEILLNIIGYFIDYEPCPILMLQPTESMAQAFSKDRIANGLLRATPALQGQRPSSERLGQHYPSQDLPRRIAVAGRSQLSQRIGLEAHQDLARR